MSADRIFKKSLVFNGFNRRSSKNHNDRIYLMRLLRLDKGDEYKNAIMVEDFCPSYMNMLILSESDFYVLDATKDNLNILRKLNKDMETGYEIIKLFKYLCSKKLSVILSQSNYSCSIGQAAPITIDIQAALKSMFNVVEKEYNSHFFEKIISDRDNLLSYYS